MTPLSSPALVGADLVASIAAKYDDEEGDLTRAALGRLGRLQAVAGKVCSKCGEKKPLPAFGRDGRKATGLQGACKQCDRDRKGAEA